MLAQPGRSSPITASELTDLPLPDSPTSATVALRGTLKDTPLMASTLLCLVDAKAHAQVAHLQQGMGRVVRS